MVLSLVNQYYCVPEGMKIRELTEALKGVEEVWAVGVVNDDGEAVGIVVTTQFQEKMGRPFSHDLLDKKPVVEVMTKTKSFAFDKNIQSVAEDLADEVRKTSNRYFLVEDPNQKFCGIFSTKDLLIHQFNAHLEDIELAVAIQQSVVPETLEKRSGGLELHAYSNMAKGVGGDFLAVKEVSAGRWVLAVCDVSGKGVAASLVTAALGGMFAQYDPTTGLPAFISQVNTFILETFKMEKYLTGVFLEYDEAVCKLVYCDMGHSYFGVLRGGSVLKSPTINPFLGFVPSLDVKSEELALEPGDLIFLYTDGLVEQTNVSGEEFGTPSFETALVDHHELPLAELASLLHRKVKKFRGDQPRGDDEAILLARVL
jgi:sigma-B regulation protein RsbU (phosphoserine phosphatase)